MATRYVRSTDGNNADDGSTWALAKLDLTGVAAIDTAGDFIYVSDAHAESTAGTVTIAIAGTAASPTYIICGDDAAEPPTAVSTGGSVTTTGTSNITISGAIASYVYGLTFNLGTGAGNGTLTCVGTTNGYGVFEDCTFNIVLTGSNSLISASGNNGAVCRWKNCHIKLAAAGQKVGAGGIAILIWEGGSILSGGTSPTTLINGGNSRARFELIGVDLSNGGSTMNIFTAGSGAIGFIRNCKLPASWSGSLVTGTLTPVERYEMNNCDSTDTNYRLWVEDYNGSIKHETTIVRTGGASDGTTALSWKMVTSANAEFPVLCLHSPEIVRWNDTTGSAITVTVEIVHDSQGSGTSSAFTNKEIWLEVMYLGTSGVPLGSFVDDSIADILATPADQTSSSETWTTTGLTTPLKQKLAVTFTPQEKGYIHAVVHMTGASDTCYVCPELTVS